MTQWDIGRLRLWPARAKPTGRSLYHGTRADTSPLNSRLSRKLQPVSFEQYMIGHHFAMMPVTLMMVALPFQDCCPA